MRRIALALMILLLAGCAGDGDEGAAPPEEANGSALSTTTTQGPSVPQSAVTRPPVDVIAGVVCDEAATRIAGDPEAPNGSWTCTKEGEQVRIDFHVDDAELQKAQEQILASYREAGDSRSLAELPVLCGPRFAIRTDTSATRDALIGDLKAADINASTCQ